jgi:hypothetical protein
MTVRTWMTLSALILVALTVAIFVRLLAPVDAPPVLVRVGDVRLEGDRVEACWPQRGGKLRCQEADTDRSDATTVPSEGEFRIVVAYPAQPTDGNVEILPVDGGKKQHFDYDDEIAYDLKRGEYVLQVSAMYPEQARVVYRFAFRTR